MTRYTTSLCPTSMRNLRGALQVRGRQLHSECERGPGEETDRGRIKRTRGAGETDEESKHISRHQRRDERESDVGTASLRRVLVRNRERAEPRRTEHRWPEPDPSDNEADDCRGGVHEKGSEASPIQSCGGAGQGRGQQGGQMRYVGGRQSHSQTGAITW
jgi:hypothetical protein